MLAIEDWARNKQPLVAMSAVTLVTISDFLYEVLPQAKDRRLFGHQFPLPDNLTTWYRMYQKPIVPLIAFVGMISDFSDIGSAIVTLTLSTRRVEKLLKRNPNYFRENPPSREEVREGIEFVKQLYTSIFAEIKDDLDSKPINPDEKARFDQFLQVNRTG